MSIRRSPLRSPLSMAGVVVGALVAVGASPRAFAAPPRAAAGYVPGPDERDLAARRASAAEVARQLPRLEPFERWVRLSGALPPAFESLAARPGLEDPLIDGRGRKVTRATWAARRADIAARVETWLLGKAPPPPGNVEGKVVEKRDDGELELWRVELTFGPGRAALLRCALRLPKRRAGRVPVFMTDNARYFSWAQDAVARGFAYLNCDARDHAYGPDDSAAYADLFGPYDWSAFRRRGWSFSRAVDWLVTQDFVDAKRIFIGGHSRSAKQAMAAAAFDERIAGVVASSPGSGGSVAYRLVDETVFGESIEILTRVFPDWVHRGVRYFAGREHLLPADSHLIYALLAPRPVLMSTATEDWVENTFAVEKTYEAVRPLFAMLGKPDNLALRYRAGHHGTDPETHAAYSRFLLAAAGIEPQTPAALFPYQPFHVWDPAAWREAEARAGAAARPPAQAAPLLDRIAWILGEGPPFESRPVVFGQGESEELAKALVRPTIKATRETFIFGDGVAGTIFWPAGAARGPDARLPCVVWLSPQHTSTGFLAPYYLSGPPPVQAFVDAGFAVLSFDPVGTGGRQAERRGFFAAHPRWSLVGKMVRDARHALDAAAASPRIDPARIYYVGYALGGTIATLAAAQDTRAAGVAVLAGVAPWRAGDRGNGGVARWSTDTGWLPRLANFVGKEAAAPVDAGELLAAVAPRPLLVVAPRDDRHAALADVERAVVDAQAAYARAGAPAALRFATFDDWNRLTGPMLRATVEWLRAGPAK